MSRENLDFIYTVYQNVLVFLKRNKYAEPAEMGREEFYNIATNKKVRIETSKDTPAGKVNLTVIILVDGDTAYKTSADMEKLINSVDDNNNILIITPEDVSSNVQKKIDSLGRDRKGKILNYHNKRFAIVFPDRERAAKHRILSKEEETEVLKVDLMTSAQNIGNIYSTGPLADPQAIWIEAKPGDLIEIKEKSETAAFIISYRRAI